MANSPLAFDYAQLANEGTTDWFSTYLVRAKKKEESDGAIDLPPPHPFSRMRFIAGLVSKKVVKIGVAITALPERAVCI